MPRFFLNVCNHEGTATDEDGREFDDVTEIRKMAIDSIRSIVSEDARAGLVDLTGYIHVTDAEDQTVARVEYRDAFEIRLPE